jgi:hypothetical protein
MGRPHLEADMVDHLGEEGGDVEGEGEGIPLLAAVVVRGTGGIVGGTGQLVVVAILVAVTGGPVIVIVLGRGVEVPIVSRGVIRMAVVIERREDVVEVRVIAVFLVGVRRQRRRGDGVGRGVRRLLRVVVVTGV